MCCLYYWAVQFTRAEAKRQETRVQIGWKENELS